MLAPKHVCKNSLVRSQISTYGGLQKLSKKKKKIHGSPVFQKQKSVNTYIFFKRRSMSIDLIKTENNRKYNFILSVLVSNFFFSDLRHNNHNKT